MMIVDGGKKFPDFDCLGSPYLSLKWLTGVHLSGVLLGHFP